MHSVEGRIGKAYGNQHGGNAIPLHARGFSWICGYCSRRKASKQVPWQDLKDLFLHALPNIAKNIPGKVCSDKEKNILERVRPNAEGVLHWVNEKIGGSTLEGVRPNREKNVLRRMRSSMERTVL